MKGLFSLCFLLLFGTAFSQVDTTPLYKRFPNVPPLQLLLADSVTKYTKADLPKKTPVLIMMFSPDCEHCQHEAEQIVAMREELKKIHIVMATTYPLQRMKEFAEAYHLNGLPNVVLGRDVSYLLPPFYDMRNFPYLALYNKNGELIETVEGSLSMEKVLEKFKAAK